MKSAPVLLLMIFSAMAYAQPIYRCENSSGELVFQDRACAEPTQSQPVAQAAPADVAYFQARDYEQGDWTHQQHRARRLQVKLEASAERLRVRTLLKPLSDRKTAEYAENHRRCKNAERIAGLCGKFAGTFYCDEKGFRSTPIVQASTPANAVIDNGSAFKMEQCALQATKLD